MGATKAHMVPSASDSQQLKMTINKNIITTYVLVAAKQLLYGVNCE